MPVNLKKRTSTTTKKRTKKTNSFLKFKKLIVPRPDVLHGYLRHNEINLYLEYLENRYSFVHVLFLGLTHERRAMKAIEIDWYSERNVITMERERSRRFIADKISANIMPPARTNLQNNSQVRNICFIEGGTHAREWISISVALNCIYQLTEKHVRNYDLLRKLRFIIVPVTNPDGYEYTLTKNRRWRKNRRPICHTRHIGTDCNRNYDFHWEDGPSKASRNTFKGVKPFSEPETRAMRNILLKYKSNLLFFLSLHSYAQSIMYPWGYCQQLPDTWQTLEKLALAGRNAIKAYNGRHYRVGSIAKLSKRRISGSVVDYAFGVINVPLALVMELPANDLGFHPPAESISPIGHESWFGIREMCRTAYDLVPPFASIHEAILANANKMIENSEKLKQQQQHLEEALVTPFCNNSEIMKRTQVAAVKG